MGHTNLSNFGIGPARFGAGLLAYLILALFAMLIVPGPAAAAKRENVVFIYIDDVSAPQFQYMPEVRKLAREGTTFEQSIVTDPLCCPARASMLTGLFAHNHTVVGKPREYNVLRKRYPETLPVWMQKADYRTGFVGKYVNGYGTRGNSESEVPKGWDSFLAFTKHFEYRYTRAKFARGNSKDGARIINFPAKKKFHAEQVLRKSATDFIRSSVKDKKRFFLWYSSPLPHAEAKGGPPIAERQDMGRNKERAPRTPAFNELDMTDKAPGALRAPLDELDVQFVDNNWRGTLDGLRTANRSIGKLRKTLQKEGVADETTVVFTADNGFHFGEHRLARGKNTPYEESILVPTWVVGPEFPAGNVVKDPVSNMDIPATILEAGRAESPWQMEGFPLQDQTAGTDPNRRIPIERLYACDIVPDQCFQGVRTARYSYWERFADGGAELYDLSDDPYQTENLLGDPIYAEVQAQLRQETAGLKNCDGQSCFGVGLGELPALLGE